MSRSSDVEVPLSREEVASILAICSSKAILVGGQALGFWADRLGVEVPSELQPTITADADFIGDSTVADELGRRLRWKTWLPSLDEASPQTGKVTTTVRGGGVKQVDFVSGVVGLTTKDVVRRALELDAAEIGRVRVMHPVDVLDSRIQNLHLLPAKRNSVGVAQAMLAVNVVRAYIGDVIARQGERDGLKLLERVVAIASDIAGVRVFLLYAVDRLSAVPLEAFRTTPKLRKERWPRVESELRKKRLATNRSLEKRSRRRSG
jgi:hypothetical protein